MQSTEHGSEEFRFDSALEALEGLKRLRANCEDQNDGVARTFTVEPVPLTIPDE